MLNGNRISINKLQHTFQRTFHLGRRTINNLPQVIELLRSNLTINASNFLNKRVDNAKLSIPNLNASDANLLNSQQSSNQSTDSNDAQELAFKRAPINWIPATVLVATPIAAAIITPWYLMKHNVSAQAWGVFAAVGVWTGLSITAGYHRLMSHRSYKAHPAVRNFFLVGATLAVQGSAFDWCSGHRTHHKYVDDRMKDPYSAKRGFWFSHIGWMLKNYPSGNFDYKNIRDLTKDKVLQIQHKYYGLWVLVANVGLIGAIGWVVGDVWGTLLLAGLVRLVLNHHLTFFINSLCHMYGKRTYTDTNTARDNFILAIPTWGEGYHNYHHFFQYDYRNGVKWWQYDPTKWLIALLAKVGLASDLRVVDDMTIKHAEVNMKFKRAQQRIDHIKANKLKDDSLLPYSIQTFSDRIEFEYDLFTETVKEWQALKTKAMQMKKEAFAEKLHEVDDMLSAQYAMIEKRIFDHHTRVKQAFRTVGFKSVV